MWFECVDLTLKGLNPANDDMKTMLPPPLSFINGAACFANRNEAFTFISKILSHTSSLQSNTAPVQI